jgi:hypothetical protein
MNNPLYAMPAPLASALARTNARMSRKPTSLLLTLLALSFQPVLGAPVGTSFTYQGRLSDGTDAATGLYDLAFSLWNASAGPAQVGHALTNAAVGVTNGLFTVSVDFGSGVFDGTARWLEVAVRANGSGSFVTLVPRQALEGTPYAQYAPTAGTAAQASAVTTDVWTNGMARMSGQTGTNITLYSSTLVDPVLPSFAYMTNGAGQTNWFPVGTLTYQNLGGTSSDGGLMDTNYTGLVMSNGPYYGRLEFIGVGGYDAGLWFWPGHGNSSYEAHDPRAYNAPELLIQSAGPICLDWGRGSFWRGLQLGVNGSDYNVYVWLNSDSLGAQALPWNTNLASTVPFLAMPEYWNGRIAARASDGGPINAMPGWQFLPRDTNGNCEFIIWDYFDTAVFGEYTTARFTWNCKARARFLLGAGGGLDLRGKLVLERTTTAPGTATVALDFNSSQCVDIAPTATAVSFYTTNTTGTITGASTNYEQRVFILRGGGAGFSATWPTGWSWLSTAPTNVIAKTLLRLQLESIGPGETNVLATAAVAVSNQ